MAIDLSIVLPIHNEKDNLAPLLDEIEAAMTTMVGGGGGGRRFEVIAVDDGSTDGSPAILKRLAATRPWLKVIVFRRNYGQSAAFDAGFRSASGAMVVTMDADRQNDPADIPRMVAAMEQGREGGDGAEGGDGGDGVDGGDGGYDFVAGRRANRKDGWVLRKLPSRIANFIIRKVTKTRLHDLGCSLKLYRRSFIDDLYLYGEMHRFIGVLMEDMGARTIEVNVNHRARPAGKSKYGLDRTFKVMLDLLTVWFMRGYQTKPIYIFGGAGIGLGALGFIFAMTTLYYKYRPIDPIFVHKQPLFILAVILVVIGVQFLVLGLLAEILVRTYFESRDRTSYFVREKINFAAVPPSNAPTPSRAPIEATTIEEPKIAPYNSPQSRTDAARTL